MIELEGMQNFDAGFGELLGYQSTVLDTAYGLEALFYADKSTTLLVSESIAYLLNRQAADGSWSDGSNTSSIFITATVTATLEKYRNVYSLNDALIRATDYLLLQRGIFGEIGNIFETALSVIAIAPMVFDKVLTKALLII